MSLRNASGAVYSNNKIHIASNSIIGMLRSNVYNVYSREIVCSILPRNRGVKSFF